MVVQPDGKIIIAGHYYNSLQFDDFALVRFNPDGTPDTTFDGDGIVTTNVSADNDYIKAVALQPDGKVVVAGTSNNTGNGFRTALARYNPNGSLDATFGSGGIVIVPLANGREEGNAVTILPDGKILVAGLQLANSNGYDFAVFKFNPDGTLDSAFGNGGRAVLGFNSFRDEARAMSVQPDGKIVLAGMATLTSNNSDFAVVRFNPNGTPDTTFGVGGKNSTPVGSAEDFANAIALQPDGKIVLVGVASNETFNSSARDFGVVRFNPNGSLDTLFGTSGKIKTEVTTNADEATAVLVQPDGNILVVGYAGIFFDAFALLRYNSSGNLDTSFGNNGKVARQFVGVNSSRARAATLLSDGKILVGGEIEGFGVARYLNAPVAPRTRPFDFDGDGKDDVSVVRMPLFAHINNVWFALKSSTSNYIPMYWGLPTDQIAPADYDGDRKTDPAVFRDGMWYILQSSNNSMRAIRFGQTGDRPFPADYDGDGKADPTVFRRSANVAGQAYWYVLNSGNNAFSGYQFGIDADVPVPGDYDGDGRWEFAVYRPDAGSWFVSRGSASSFSVDYWGKSGDRPVPGDYDGDGRNDFAVFRPDTGQWIVKTASAPLSVTNWGIASDTPAPADYDGDGKTDIAVYRNGNWYIRQSQSNTLRYEFFGGDQTDKPAPAIYLP
jgi:uncharacterized delta-60 repeat protein